MRKSPSRLLHRRALLLLLVRISYILAPGRLCDRIRHGAAVGNVESRFGRVDDNEATACGSKLRTYGTDDDVKKRTWRM